MSKFTRFLIISSVIIVHLILILLIYMKFNQNKVEIVLNTNAGIPFSWNCKISDTTIASISDECVENLSPKDVTGGRLQIHYVIDAHQIGSTTAICEYRNFVDNILYEQKIYNIDVDKNLNVKLDEK